MPDNPKSSWLSSAFLLVGALLVAYLIYALAAENRELKATIAELQQGPPADGLQVGESLSDVALESLEGSTGSLAGLAPEGGVVVFLTTTCPYCKQTLPTWSDLAARYAERGVPFAGVSFHDRADTAAYAEAESIPFPLWVLSDFEEAPAVRVPSVPFTALVGPDGRVLRAWLGPIDAEAEQVLIAALDAELAESGRFLSGSSDRDPGCCQDHAPGTGAGN